MPFDVKKYRADEAEIQQMNRDYEDADQAGYLRWLDEQDAQALRPWAESLLQKPDRQLSGAELEQRHTLDEAANPEFVDTLFQLALTARSPQHIA
ncbi:hypothetical protein [Kitasatospora sp. NPDC088134]|uniref:hypothetical protein n=1 Tax=Kitasatospora sp. NPDC088134 TaxID=3364071 RepID=UPI003809B4D3